MDQLNLIDIYRTFHPKTMNFTFFSSAHGTFSRIDHILGHKYGLGKFEKIEIISSIFSDHNAVRLDVNYRKVKVKVAQLCPTLCWNSSGQNTGVRNLSLLQGFFHPRD